MISIGWNLLSQSSQLKKYLTNNLVEGSTGLVLQILRNLVLLMFYCLIVNPSVLHYKMTFHTFLLISTIKMTQGLQLHCICYCFVINYWIWFVDRILPAKKINSSESS